MGLRELVYEPPNKTGGCADDGKCMIEADDTAVCCFRKHARLVLLAPGLFGFWPRLALRTRHLFLFAPDLFGCALRFAADRGVQGWGRGGKVWSRSFDL